MRKFLFPRIHGPDYDLYIRSMCVLWDLKIDNAANLDGAVLKCMNKKSFLKCGNCNKRLKLILVACKTILFG